MFNKFLFVTATILSCSFCFAQNNISFIKGKKINKVSTIQTKSSSEMMGQTMEQNIITTSWSEIVITEVFDNEIKVEDKGTKIKMKMEAMGQEMEYDSDKPNENENFKKAGDLLNKVTNITANFQGLITSIKYDATMEQQIKEIPAIGSGYNTGQPLDFILIPPKDALVGKTWTISFLLDDIKTDYNYTIKSIDNEIANVELTSNVSTNKKMETQGMEIVTKLSGTLLSTILVDTKTNLVKSNISTSSQKGSIEIMGQSSPMEVTTTNKILFE